MNLNFYGLFIMIFSWTLITGTFIYCYIKVFKKENQKDK